MIDPLGEHRQLTPVQWYGYGLAVMQLLIAQDQRASAKGRFWYPMEEAAYQAALQHFRDMQQQTPWWVQDCVYRGLRIMVTLDGQIAHVPCTSCPCGGDGGKASP
jgi:hypothetical protein